MLVTATDRLVSEVPLPDLVALDRASVLHPSTNLADFASGKLASTIVDTASGVRIRDNKGNELIDGFAGLYCVNIGYGRSEVARLSRGRRTSWPIFIPMPVTPLKS